jgi:hypothetical protein
MKTRNVLLIVLAVVCVIFFLISGALSNQTPAAPPPTLNAGQAIPVQPTAQIAPAPAPDKHNVTYLVTSRMDFNVTYQNAQGGTQQDDGFKEWKKDFRIAPGQFVYVSAQNGDDSLFAKITCTIKVDGVEFKTSTSEGAYKIATCSGPLP